MMHGVHGVKILHLVRETVILVHELDLHYVHWQDFKDLLQYIYVRHLLSIRDECLDLILHTLKGRLEL